jgi:mannose-6-phosphate isomerase-like protein (cupin superfamily)
MQSTGQDQNSISGKQSKRPEFAIFRRSEAPSLAKSGAMSKDGVMPEAVEPLQQMQAGTETRYLFGGAGLSLVYVWFKSNYPVALHAHNADCVYYITNGSIRFGTQDLGVGDGFFVPAGMHYTYTAGAEGVEVLECRSAETYDIQISTTRTNKAYWDKISTTIAQESGKWADEPRPSERMASA